VRDFELLAQFAAAYHLRKLWVQMFVSSGFLYRKAAALLALPLCIWGGRRARLAGCGYLCTLGFLGAAINFFYPVNVLSHYSCLSFAGMHTLLYHGSMLFCCMLIRISHYHRYSDARTVGECFLPALPLLLWSIPANIINFSPINSDYMFFKCNSFFLPALFGSLPDGVTTVLAYALYLLLPTAFYILPYLLGKWRSGGSKALEL
jgi:hypothetical protein